MGGTWLAQLVQVQLLISGSSAQAPCWVWHIFRNTKIKTNFINDCQKPGRKSWDYSGAAWLAGRHVRYVWETQTLMTKLKSESESTCACEKVLGLPYSLYVTYNFLVIYAQK